MDREIIEKIEKLKEHYELSEDNDFHNILHDAMDIKKNFSRDDVVVALATLIYYNFDNEEI